MINHEQWGTLIKKIVRRLEDSEFAGQYLDFTELRNQYFRLYITVISLYRTEKSIFKNLQNPETNIIHFIETRNQYFRLYRTDVEFTELRKQYFRLYKTIFRLYRPRGTVEPLKIIFAGWM